MFHWWVIYQVAGLSCGPGIGESPVGAKGVGGGGRKNSTNFG